MVGHHDTSKDPPYYFFWRRTIQKAISRFRAGSNLIVSSRRVSFLANITDFFIDSLYNISKRELEHKYVEIAQRCILDYLGVSLAGASLLSSEMNSYLGNFLNEGGSCTVIGMNSKTTLYNAVFVNGFNAHVAELDDGHRYAAVHPGADHFGPFATIRRKPC